MPLHMAVLIKDDSMKTYAGRMLLCSLLVVAAITNIVGQLHADHTCCAQCGGTDGCQKVCRLVCETKKITTICWGCQREDFCIPGPSSVACRHVDYVCGDDTDPKAPCSEPKKFPWTEWIPGG